MTNKQDYSIPGIFDNTLAIFENARTTLKSKRNIREFVEADPTDIDVEILDYAAAIDIIDELIVKDTIVDEDSFSVIYQLTNKYYIYTRDDYPGIGRMMETYMATLEAHRLERFDG